MNKTTTLALAFFTLLASVGLAANVTTNQSNYIPGTTILFNLTSPGGDSVSDLVNLSLYEPGNSTIVYSTNVTLSSVASNTTTYSVPNNAKAGQWNATIFNSSGSYNYSLFNISGIYNTTGISTNASMVFLFVGNSTSVAINLTSWSNVNDTLNVTIAAGCDGVNLTCVLTGNNSFNQTSITAFGRQNVTLNVTSSGTKPGNFVIRINVSRWNSTGSGVFSNQTFFTVNVRNGSNGFVTIKQQEDNQSVTPTTAFVYNFTINNTGSVNPTYSLTNSSSSKNFTCEVSTASTSAPTAGLASNVTVSVTVRAERNATFNQVEVCTITVDDSLGFVQNLYFGTLAGSYYNASLVALNSSFYVAPGQVLAFNVTVNNTGNRDESFNLTVVDSFGWYVNVSNSSGGVTNVNGTNATMTVVAGTVSDYSTGVLIFTVAVPGSAFQENFTNLTLSLYDVGNTTRSAAGLNVSLKLPVFNFTVIGLYNTTSGNFSINITRVLRQINGTNFTNVSSFFVLNFSIYNSSGALMYNVSNVSYNQRLDINVSQTTLLNASNLSGFPVDLYNLTVFVNDTTNGFAGNFSTVFRISRATRVLFSTNASTVNSGDYVKFNVSSFYDTGENNTPLIIGSNGLGLACTLNSNTFYNYTCQVSVNSSGTYALTLVSNSSSCSGFFACTIFPVLSNSSMISMIVSLASGSSGSTGGAGLNQSSNGTGSTSQSSVGENLTLTLPGTTTLASAGSSLIQLLIANNGSNNLTVTVSDVVEQGDYLHFGLTLVAPSIVLGNSNASINLTVAPFKFFKPGTYTISLSVNGQAKEISVTLPDRVPDYVRNKTEVTRFVEVKKGASESKITLKVKNTNSFTAEVNLTEEIPKALAANASVLTASPVFTKIIQEDPIVLWTLQLPKNSEKEVSYNVMADAGSTDFAELNVSVARASSTAFFGSDLLSDPLVFYPLLAILVLASALAVYVYVWKPRVEKQKPRAAAVGPSLPVVSGEARPVPAPVAPGALGVQSSPQTGSLAGQSPALAKESYAQHPASDVNLLYNPPEQSGLSSLWHKIEKLLKI